MPEVEYTFYIEHPHCHWLCIECGPAALKSVQTDMEERCKNYMKMYDEKFKKIETELVSKADKVTVAKLSADLIASDNIVKGLVSDVTNTANKVDLIMTEQEEIARRQNNTII